jgi:Zn-finger protein
MQKYKFFSNKECEYYPCHKMPEGEELNCLFCYCPLYALGKDCGGDYRITEKGIKDCTPCTTCHGVGGYEHVRERIGSVLELAQKNL